MAKKKSKSGGFDTGDLFGSFGGLDPNWREGLTPKKYRHSKHKVVSNPYEKINPIMRRPL